jgi:hypothetical protein
VDALLAVDGVVRVAVEDDGFNEGLGALIEFQFDVVGEVFIDLKGLAEVRAKESAGGLCRIEGGLQVWSGHRSGNSWFQCAWEQGFFPFPREGCTGRVEQMRGSLNNMVLLGWEMGKPCI